MQYLGVDCSDALQDSQRLNYLSRFTQLVCGGLWDLNLHLPASTASALQM